MQKQGKGRKSLIVGIVAAVVILAALLTLLLTQCDFGGQNAEPSTEDTSNVVPTYDLYWNLDRAEFAGKSEAGMSSRQPEADGYFHVRFAFNGEQITVKVKDRKLINAIDAADIVGLEFDKDGIVSEVLQLDDMPLEKVAWKFYVQSVGGKVIKANSSETYEGMETMLQNNGAIIMDVVGKEGPAGCLGNPVEGDRIYAIANKAGELTHVFIYERPTYMLYHDAYCEHCEETVKWGEWVRTDILPTKTGHYQLQTDVQLKKQQSMSMDDQKICLDLNGKRVDGGNGWRIYALFNPGSSLALMDTSEEKTGTLAAHGDGDQGMCVWVRYGQFHLYEGILDASDAKSDLNGVAINVPKNAYFYMYGGEIIGGKAYPRYDEKSGSYKNALGGAMFVNGKFVMHGGVIRDGYAEAVTITKDGKTSISRGLGGNIFASSSAELELNGGVIKNGRAGNLAGNIYMDGGCTIAINGARIEGGRALGKDKSAGSIMIGSSKATLTMNSGAITGGISNNTGGNVYVQGTFTMNGGTVSGGKCYSSATGELNADCNSYNVRVYNGKFVMNGGRVDGGVAIADSSTTDKYQATLILAGNPVIKSGAENAINLTIATGGNPKIVVNKLGAKACIGVTTQRGVFTEPTAQQNVDKFFSDVEGAEVLYTEQGLALGRFSCVCGHRTHINGCDGTVHLWAPWTSKTSLPTKEGNYFLTKDVTTTYAYWVAKEATVRLDLNGKNVTLDVPNHYGDGFRVYVADWLSTLVITDTTDKPGTLRTVMPTAEEAQATLAEKVANGEFTADEAKTKLNNQEKGNSGMIFWAYGGNVVMHNGILDNSHNTGSKAGMTVYASRRTYNEVEGIPTFTMYGGLIKGAETSSYGAAICGGKKSEINIHGGIVEGGRSTGSVGGNIYVGGKLYMDGGIVRNGYAASAGGNMYLESASDWAASAVITGTAQVLGGTTGDASAKKDWGRGGNIRVIGVSGKDATLTVDGNAVIADGRAIKSGSGNAGHGGNIMSNGSSVINIKSGTISNGIADVNAGNIYAIGEVNISGGTITGGQARYGGTMYAYNGAKVTISGGTISGGKAVRGGNFALEPNGKDVIFNISGGTITDGVAYTSGGTEGRGGNFWTYSNSGKDGATKFTMTGGTISNGKSDGFGGNFYTAGAGNDLNVFTLKGGVISGGETEPSVELAKKIKGGAGIYASSSKVQINVDGATIIGGESKYGGTVEIYNGAQLNMTSGILAGGKASRGAVLCIYSYGSSKATVANISGGTITGGTGERGNIWVYGEKTGDRVELNISGTAKIGSKVEVGGVTYKGATGAVNGGNIYATTNSYITMTGGVIENGYATKGGNIYLGDSSKNQHKITGGVIRNGEAKENGGNIYVLSKLEISGNALVEGGKSVYSGGSVFASGQNAKLTLKSGAVISGGICGNGYNGGAIHVGAKAELTISGATIYGGEIKYAGTDPQSKGGAIYTKGTVTMEDGAIIGGYARNGGAVFVHEGGSFTMEGGVIVGGEAFNGGGNVGVQASSSGAATFVMEGGTISGGTAKTGGNVWIYGGDSTHKSTFQLKAGSIGGSVTVENYEHKGGTCNGSNGGNVLVSTHGKLIMSGGEIVGGTANVNANGENGNGGNIAMDSSSAVFEMTGGTISDGTAKADAQANVAQIAGTATITNGTVDGGYMVWDSANATLNLSGKAVIKATTAGKPSLTLGGSTASDEALKCKVNVGAMDEDADISVAVPSGDKDFAKVTTDCGETWKTTILSAEGKTIYLNGDVLTFVDPTVTPGPGPGTEPDEPDPDEPTAGTLTEHCVCGADRFGGEHAPNCDGTKLQWTEWTDALAAEQNGSGKTAENSLPTVSGKYYLTKTVTLSGQYIIESAKTVYLDLNGHAVNAPSNNRAFYLNHADAKLVITDSSDNGNGYVQGGVVSNKSGSVVYLDTRGGSVTLFRGTIKGGSVTRTDSKAALGGVLYMTAGSFTVNGGRIEAGQLTPGTGKYGYGGVGYVSTAGNVEINGGTIIAGEARYGGAFYLLNGVNLEMTGGQILGGKGDRGAALAVEGNANAATATITGGTITGGEGDRGNIWVYGNKTNVYATLTIGGTANIGGTVTFDGVTYSGVKNASTGGNIYMGQITELIVNGGTIENGTASSKGGNIYADNGTTSKVTVNGGVIRGGTAPEGANVYCNGPMTVTGGTIDGGVVFGTSLTVSGSPVINAEGKSNVFVKTGKTITVGALETGAKIGVTLEDETAVFTGAVDASYASYFVSDNKAKAVAHKAEGLYLKEKPNNEYCVCGASKLGGEHAPNCDEQDVEWTEWTDTLAAEQNGADKTASNSLPTVSGNYYLSAGVQLTDTYNLAKGVYLYLDLNGNYVKAASGKRAFNMGYSQSELVITDSSAAGNGYILGNTVSGKSGATVLVNNADTRFVLFRGSIVGGSGSYGGNVYIKPGAFIMNGGSIVGGYATSGGGNIFVESNSTANNASIFTMNGGTISGGSVAAGKKGGNVALYGSSINTCQFVMNGGSVGGAVTVNSTEYKGGTANTGGNFRVSTYATLTVNNGTITGGTAVDNGSTKGEGGNIFIENKSGNGVTIVNGIISNGSAYYGGNISANSPLTISGGTITGGNANAAEGANILVYNNTTTITGGTIDGGINFSGTATLTISGKPQIAAEGKANITVKDGMTITVGTLETGAKIGITLKDEKDVFTNAVDASYAGYFVSDNQNKAVVHTAEGLALAEYYCLCGATKNGGECYEDLCDGTKYVWKAWTDTTKLPVKGGNWYLTGNVELSETALIVTDKTAGETMVLDLNGYNVTSAKNRVFSTYAGTEDDANPFTLVMTNTYKPVDENDARTGTITLSGEGDQGRVVWLTGNGKHATIYNVKMTMAEGAKSKETGAFLNVTATTSKASSLSLYKVTLTNGKTDKSGAAVATNKGELVMKDCTVSNCVANNYGGAVYVFSGSLARVSNSTFTECQAVTKRGGAFYLEGDLEMVDSRIIDCSAKERSGGIDITSGVNVTLDGVTIDGCSTTGNSSRGGGIYNYQATLEMTDCTITNCNSGSATTTGCLGGAVYQYNCTTKLGGLMIIKDNYQQGTQACDMYTNGAKVQILEGGLTAGSEIGVRDGTNAVICNNITATDAGYFFSNGSLVPSHSGTTLKLVAAN